MEGEVVLLANVVELADDFGVAVDAEFLALGEQKLLVDEVAEEVIDGLVEVGLGEIVLAGVLEELLLGALYSLRVMIWSLMRATTSSTTAPLGVMGGGGAGRKLSVEAGSKLRRQPGSWAVPAAARAQGSRLPRRRRDRLWQRCWSWSEPALEVDACKLLGHPFLMQNRPCGVLAKRSDEHLTAQPGRGYLAISFYRARARLGGSGLWEFLRARGDGDCWWGVGGKAEAEAGAKYRGLSAPRCALRRDDGVRGAPVEMTGSRSGGRSNYGVRAGGAVNGVGVGEAGAGGGFGRAGGGGG